MLHGWLAGKQTRPGDVVPWRRTRVFVLSSALPHVHSCLVQVLLNEVRNDLNLVKVDQAELEELREFRSDVARKEKAHADLIASQAKRLDELEALYKEEQV